MVRDTVGNFELLPLLDTLTTDLVGKVGVPTKMSALHWINMLLKNINGCMGGGGLTAHHFKGWWKRKVCQQCQSFSVSIPLMVPQPCRHFLLMPNLLRLPCGISAGEKQIISGCDCSIHRVYGENSM